MSARELRAQFEEKLAGGAVPGGGHPNDLARLADDAWVQKFIDQYDGDMSQALQMMIDSFTWRSKFGTNDINESNINMDCVKEGLFYPRGKDNDGCTIFIFKCKKYVKGSRSFDELTRCLVYWFERMDKVDNCKQISVFFDLADSGLSNLDMEFTRYIINLFKLYYPDFLNYIFIFEMPWVLNAAFKVIKALLPAKAVAKMKFVTKSTITQFIPMDQAQKSWGGNDDYTFSFVSASFPGDVSGKRVKFADTDSPIRDEIGDSGNGDDSQSMMKLSPRDTIVFKNIGNEIAGNFTITNVHSGFLAYKVKTTAPEKTKVWPSVGVLPVGKTESVKLSLISQGHNQATASRIKFLVVCTPVNVGSLTTTELSELWKDMSKLTVEQHRLKCSLHSVELAKNGSIVDSDLQTDNEKQIIQLNQTISGLKTNQEQLDSQMKGLKTVQLVNLMMSALLLGLVLYFFRSFGQLSDNYGEFCNRA